MRLLLLVLALLVAPLSVQAATDTFTPTDTPTWTPTATPTATKTGTPTQTPSFTQTATIKDLDGGFTGIADWGLQNSLGQKGGKQASGAALGKGRLPGDYVADCFPMYRTQSTYISQGMCVAQSGAFAVSPTGSLMDQGFVGVALNSQGFFNGRIWVAYDGIIRVQSAVNTTRGSFYVPTSAGKMTAAAEVADPAIFTPLSKTVKFEALEDKTISGSDNLVRCRLSIQ